MYFGPMVTWIAVTFGNACSPFALLQAEGIPLDCFSLLISLCTFFLPLYVFILYYLQSL